LGIQRHYTQRDTPDANMQTNPIEMRPDTGNGWKFL
jgi:hypothetical protein